MYAICLATYYGVQKNWMTYGGLDNTYTSLEEAVSVCAGLKGSERRVVHRDTKEIVAEWKFTTKDGKRLIRRVK